MTVANALTILRLVLIPVFVNALWYGRNDVAFIVFAVAGITDWLDGALARWLHQRSRLGEYLDPAADKLLLVTAYVVLAIPALDAPNPIPIWLTTLVVSRDVIIVVASAVIYLTSGNIRFKPTLLGKISTGTQVSAMFVVLFLNMLGTVHWMADVAVYAVLLTTVGSGVHYIYHARNLVEEPVVRGNHRGVDG